MFFVRIFVMFFEFLDSRPRFLRRKGVSASEEWRAACGKIIDSAQSRVAAKKGARLYTGF